MPLNILEQFFLKVTVFVINIWYISFFLPILISIAKNPREDRYLLYSVPCWGPMDVDSTFLRIIGKSITLHIITFKKKGIIFNN
jgi:hypothetical protein